jgi:hypothetical protein
MRARPTGKEPAVIPATTHLCCAQCRLRFTPAAAAYVVTCPECGDTPRAIASLELTFGFRVIGPEDLPHEFPYATAVSIALPTPGAPTKPEVE